MKLESALAVLAAGSICLAPASAQTPAPNPTQRNVSEHQQEMTPVYRVTVVARTTPTINYRHRSGSTTIDFEGTPLLPKANGEAKVESKQGYIEIEVEFDELEPATKFGPEYLTYVMWAITPEGRATNLGEVLLNGNRSKLNVTSELQMFGLIVTAEPYFAVSQPSDVVVMENRVRPDTLGRVEQVEARYELLKRGTYLMEGADVQLARPAPEDDTPLELYEARNAVALSRLAGAERHAAQTFDTAVRLLAQAEHAHADDRGRKGAVAVAREAVQRAEDARLIAIERQEEARVAREREDAARREAEARAEADRARREAGELTARTAREKADAEAARAEAERARAEAEAAARRLAEERAAADAARAALEAEAERARQAVASAEQEKAELRARLQQQLNLILETRDTARGLIVSMPDVLFDFDRHSLRPGAREKLAKVAGVLLAYPALRLEVEGHTDSVGADDYNQRLSERRAEAVRSYLTTQGITPDFVVARGYGEARPLVTNDSAEGRQQNRRVEVVVSGEPIDAPEISSRQ